MNELNILFPFIDILLDPRNLWAESFGYLFYSLSNISNPNFENYTVKFDESIYPWWYVNLRYLDKNLIRVLSPDINPDSWLIFENINYLRKKDTPILDIILSYFPVDAYSKSHKTLPIKMYPYYEWSNFKYKLNKIETVYAFIEKISKNLIKENLIISINNWILEDSDLIYLCRK